MMARIVRGPAVGWLAVVLVFVMAIVVALAIDDVAWVLGREGWTDVLPLCAALGAAIGLGGALLGWSRWTTHLVGAAFAGLLIPIFAGLVVTPGASPGQAFRITAEGTLTAYLDLFVRGRPLTQEVVHYVLTLGIICWATGQFGAYAVFGRQRPLNAVVVMGIVLLTNMALTSNDQLPYLVVFAAASLFLLIGMHAFDERSTWIRRRIGDPTELSGLYLKGGSLFVAAALVGSLFLTDRAASDPLAGAWDNIDQQLIELGEAIQGYVPSGGATRGGSVNFSTTTRIPSTWTSDSTTAFRVTLPPGELAELYWRAGTWDTYDPLSNEWVQTADTEIEVPSGTPVLAGTADMPNPSLSREVTVTIRPDDGYRSGRLLSPADPLVLDRDVRVRLVGDGGWFSSIDGGSGRAPYTVTALVPVVGDDGWNANMLRAASREYPEDVLLRYAGTPGEVLGPDARALLDEVLRRAVFPNATPYDIAATMQGYFRSSAFRYDTNVSEYDCGDISVAECFARFREGFCLHYASTMILLLRELGIPARLAQGFLPGDLVLGTREVVVANRDAHAWVEVYFPGYGWNTFDPTGGSVAQLEPLPRGPAVEAPTPTPNPSGPAPTPQATSRGDNEPDDSSSGGGGIINRPDDPTALITLTALLALIVLGAALAAWWYGPRGEVSADGAWRSLSRLAARFGLAPRPTDTVYEYAAALGDALPAARPDLETVARAKVEVVYARASMTGDRLAGVREASRRLRVQLLRLALPGRRRPRRRG